MTVDVATVAPWPRPVEGAGPAGGSWAPHPMPVGSAWLSVAAALGQVSRRIVVREGADILADLAVAETRAIVPRCSAEFLLPGIGSLPSSGIGAPTYLGSPTGYRNEVRRGSGVAAERWVRPLMAHLEQMAEKGPVLLPYTASEGAGLLAAAGAVVDLADVEMVVPVGEEPAHLSAHRRRRLAAERRKIALSNVETAVVPLESCLREVAVLVREHDVKYGGPGQRPASDYVDYLTLLAGSADWQAAVATTTGQIVASSVLVVHESEVYVRMYGCDPAVAPPGSYFELCMHVPREFAGARGLRRVRLGIESYRAKWDHGAVGDPLWTVLVPGSTLDRDAAATAMRTRRRTVLTGLAAAPELCEVAQRWGETGPEAASGA